MNHRGGSPAAVAVTLGSTTMTTDFQVQYRSRHHAFFQPVLFSMVRWGCHATAPLISAALMPIPASWRIGGAGGRGSIEQHRYQQQFLDLQGLAENLVMATVYVKDNDIEFASEAEEDGSARGHLQGFQFIILRKTLEKKVDSQEQSPPARPSEKRDRENGVGTAIPQT